MGRGRVFRRGGGGGRPPPAMVIPPLKNCMLTLTQAAHGKGHATLLVMGARFNSTGRGATCMELNRAKQL